MLSSLFEIKSSLWNTKFMKGIKGSLSTGFSSVYYLYCQMQKSIKSFLQGLVLSQLIFPICIGHELLVLLPRPYVLKRCWLFLCMVFSHLGQSLSQGSASFLSSHSLQMNKNIIFKQETSLWQLALSVWQVCHQEVVICQNGLLWSGVDGRMSEKHLYEEEFSKD